MKPELTQDFDLDGAGVRLVPLVGCGAGVVTLVVQLAGRVDDQRAVAESHQAAVRDDVETIWKWVTWSKFS